MILVLAQSTDIAAERFVTYANAAGMQCIMPDKLSDIEIGITSERNGQAVVTLCAGAEQVPVHSVLNRGLPSSEGSDPAQRFQVAETLAGWWSVLACFPGPVINRPSRWGFLPDLESLSLIQTLPRNIEITSTYVTVGNFPVLAEPRINVHLLRNSEFLGQLNHESCRLLSPDEVYKFTGFDPTRTLHVLQVGNHVLNLSDRSGSLPYKLNLGFLHFMERIAGTFSLVVFQDCGGILRMVHATPFPALCQYRHLENLVHQSLLEYLIA